MKVNAKIMSG